MVKPNEYHAISHAVEKKSPEILLLLQRNIFIAHDSLCFSNSIYFSFCFNSIYTVTNTSIRKGYLERRKIIAYSFYSDR